MSLMSPQKLRRIRVFDLSNSLSEMEERQIEAVISQTFHRILKSESMIITGNITKHNVPIVYTGMKHIVPSI